MKAPWILVVDDDVRPTDLYLDALKKSGFDTIQFTTPEEGFEFLKSNLATPPFLIVLDSMMPPGERYTTEETQEGMTTGTELFRDIRAICNASVVVLTNLDQEEHLDKWRDVDPEIVIFQKIENFPFHFASKVKTMLAGRTA